MPPKGAPDPIEIVEGMATPSADAPLDPRETGSRAVSSAALDGADASANVAPTALARPKNLRRLMALVVSAGGAAMARGPAAVGVRKSVKMS